MRSPDSVTPDERSRQGEKTCDGTPRGAVPGAGHPGRRRLRPLVHQRFRVRHHRGEERSRLTNCVCFRQGSSNTVRAKRSIGMPCPIRGWGNAKRNAIVSSAHQGGPPTRRSMSLRMSTTPARRRRAMNT